MRYVIENEVLTVSIDSIGAEVKSVRTKSNDHEYMWNGDPKYWNRTSPILFPVVGSCKEKKYIYRGQEYHIPQHGFARDSEFALLDKTATEIWFSLKDNESSRSVFPFGFELKIGYRVDGYEVHVFWKVSNPSDDELLFQIGAHPGFMCPDKTGYKLYFEGTQEIHHHGNDVDSGLSIVEDNIIHLTDNRVTITDDFFDRCTYMVEDRQTDCVGIEDGSGKRIVDVVFDAPLFAIWSPEKKNAPFICIEPWYGRCDAIDFRGEFGEREYTNMLRPSETFEREYLMRFYE